MAIDIKLYAAMIHQIRTCIAQFAAVQHKPWRNYKMAGRPRKITSLQDEITKQEEIVAKSKAKYNADTKKLKDLYSKQDEAKKKELFTAVENSSKSYEEILSYLQKE